MTSTAAEQKLPSSLAMPLLLLNMGGELAYILQQRLDAQNIEAEKSRRVRMIHFE